MGLGSQAFRRALGLSSGGRVAMLTRMIPRVSHVPEGVIESFGKYMMLLQRTPV